MADRPSVGVSLRQTLAENLVNAPPAQDRRGSTTSGSTRASYEPVRGRSGSRRGNADRLNRDAFQENQRRLAAEILQQRRACCGCCVLFVLALAWISFTFWVYFRAFVVYSEHGNDACDQPLGKWLLVVILALPIRIFFVLLHKYLKSGSEGEDTFGTIVTGRILNTWTFVGNPLLIWFGYNYMVTSHTCHKTNPDLYNFTKLFLIYQLVVAIVGVLVFFSATGLILFLWVNGAFDDGPGLARAAMPGTVDKLETVPFSPGMFDTEEAMECCVCQVAYDSSSRIKKTPCGHFFHEECIKTWLERYAKSCPICRLDLEGAAEGEAGP